ncbi:MAG: hypothetical protein ACKO3T_22400, partial [Planctomycetaceae bacterium]
FAANCLRTEKAGPYPEPVQHRLQYSQQLRATPGKDLVFVSSPPKDDYHYSWLHNQPNIDSADILWVLSLNADSDKLLRSHFSDRCAWVLSWEDRSPKLQPIDDIE